MDQLGSGKLWSVDASPNKTKVRNEKIAKMIVMTYYAILFCTSRGNEMISAAL